MTASPLTTSAVLPSSALATPATPTGVDPLGVEQRRRRRTAAQVRSLTDSGAGAGLVAQQLPFSARASVSVGRGLLFPVVGAVVGTLLLGIPGTIIGGVVGWLVSRR